MTLERNSIVESTAHNGQQRLWRVLDLEEHTTLDNMVGAVLETAGDNAIARMTLAIEERNPKLKFRLIQGVK